MARQRGIRLDPVLLMVLGGVLAAVLLPARGAASDAVIVAARVAVSVLFFLYGGKLSLEQAWHGLRQWRLHALVLITTFLIFPILGLAIRALVRSWMDEELHSGLLFMCLVSSTMQSAILFTSIARGHVSAAIVSASLSNILGVLLAPILVLFLMDIGGGSQAEESALADFVLQLFVPFVLGQLARRWIGALNARHPGLMRWIDRAAILLLVYAAYSLGVATGGWTKVEAWHLVAVVALDALLLALALGITTALGRAAHLNRDNSVVLMFCGSQKSLVSGLPMAMVMFPEAISGVVMLPLMIYHQLQLVVGAVIASKLGRKVVDQADSAALPAVAEPDERGESLSSG
ncbi:Sodium Bile acid symporter family protein [Mycobacterium marinum]|uniref:bile acid:sodium symporter family protein n=1 Tax=Mycobacterium marinum TaxID=1781 RepID=UPI000ED49D0E|nr:bile acid:sodium symporter family protein [Mycobacterium marinum]MDC9006692.1 bile acid:sodium symporter [Mycobacterium marinum]RFZ50312.1 Sodium Bile acid symporter family protein [Mycobacterium marinum]